MPRFVCDVMNGISLLPVSRSSLSANPTSMAMSIHAQTRSSFSMKSLRAFKNSLQKGLITGGALKFDPKCYSLSLFLFGSRPFFGSVSSLMQRPSTPTKGSKIERAITYPIDSPMPLCLRYTSYICMPPLSQLVAWFLHDD